MALAFQSSLFQSGLRLKFIAIYYVTGVFYMSHPSHSFCFDAPNDIGSLLYLQNVAISYLLMYRTNVRSVLTQAPNK